MTAQADKITYATIDLWRRAVNRKLRSRRLRKASRATRQHRGQRKRHNRRGHAWRNGHPSAMSSRSW